MALPILGIISAISSIAPTIASALQSKDSSKADKAINIISTVLGSASKLSLADMSSRLRHLNPDQQIELQRLDQELQLEIEKNLHEENMAQLDSFKSVSEINLENARSPDKFSSRWRPMVAWICGIAIGLHFLLLPLLVSLLSLTVMFGVDPKIIAQVKDLLPNLDIPALMTLLGWLLGYGGFKTYESIKSRKQ